MARVKRGTNKTRRRNKVLKSAKGYRGSKSLIFKTANDQVHQALAESYIGRKQRKREFRKLWIMRINAAARQHGMSYSKFIAGLKKANIEINRKMLSEMAIHDQAGFEELVNIAKAN